METPPGDEMPYFSHIISNSPNPRDPGLSQIEGGIRMPKPGEQWGASGDPSRLEAPAFEVWGSRVDKGARGQGLGRLAYLSALARHGSVLSGPSVSLAARKAWQSLDSASSGTVSADVHSGKSGRERHHAKVLDLTRLNSLLYKPSKMAKSDARKQVASIAVIDGDRLLMGKRNDNGRVTLPGGHLNPGESPAEGASRELYEETGIRIDPSKLRHLGSEEVTTFTGKSMIIHSYACFGYYNTDTERDPDDEVQNWYYVDVSGGLPKEISDNLHSPKNTTLKLLGLQNG
jgi:8-oxo-dGTP pyrophosphatase MutT (NUDIX family)